MKAVSWLTIAVLVNCTLYGCSSTPESKPKANSKEEKIQAALAELKPQDRTLAEAQKFCAVQNKQRLGSMGPPVKVMVKDKPVFLCCGHCDQELKKHPEETLKKAEELRAANK